MGGDEAGGRVRRLGGGRYQLRVDGLGRSWSALGDIAVAGAGYPERHGGVVVYIRDLDRGTFWSTGLLPTVRRPDRYDVWLDAPAPRFVRQDAGIETATTLTVAEGEAAELRRVTVTNRSDRPRRLEVTTFVPVALDTVAAYAGHPAFSKLFVETDYLPRLEGLLARRRPRGPDDLPLAAVHLLVPDDDRGDEPERETDRARFLGRGASPAAPAALARDRALSGTTGRVLDPALCLRRAAALAPGESASFTAVLGAGTTPIEAEGAVAGFVSQRSCGQAFPATPKRALGRNDGGAILARFGARLDEDGAGEPDVAGGAGGASSPASRSRPDLRFFNGYGGFSPDGAEYVIPLGEGPDRLRRPPLPWINVVANPLVGFLASETGAGYTWAGNSRLNRLTPWHNDPVTDPHGEAVYLRDEEEGAFWSPLPGPAPGPGPYEARHGFGYSRWRHESRGLEQEVWQLVAPDDPVKLMRLRITNRTDRPRRLTACACFEWVLGGGAEDRERVVAAPAADGKAVLARNPGSEDFGGAVAFATAVPARPGGAVRATAERGAFLGPREDPCAPEALLTGAALEPAEAAGDGACAALQVPLEVGPGASAEVTFLLGQAGSEAEALSLIGRCGRPGFAAAALEESRARWADLLGRVRVETPSPALDLMLNGWLLYQDLSCRLWGRSALYQSGGAFGFRDQLQDATAFVYADPDLTRRQILLHAAHQFPEGDVLHWWHPPADRGIRTRFSDDLLWLPWVAAFYIDVTGDDAVLDERAGFVRGRPLEPGEDEAYMRAERCEEAADVYGHCCLALDRSLTRGAHGLPLIGTGDWNDGMNRVGREGRGESVWLGFFLAAILERWIPVCEGRGDSERAGRYTAYLEELRAALNDEGWDGAWYRRAFYDDGAPIGSAGSDECRIDAIAQAWAVLSGVAPADRAERALDALERHLVDDEHGLIRLLSPPFDRTPRDPGYIKGYLPGVRENGGQYTHGVLWAVRAMAEAGRGERAAELLEMLLPVNHARTPEEVERYRVEPYVVAADVYGEEPHVGRGGWTWYTGSAAWMYRVALESILGFEVRDGDRLRFTPCLPAAWPGYRLSWRLPDGETTYEVEVRRDGAGPVAAAWIDGESVAVVDGVPEIPLERDGRSRRVVVELGREAAGVERSSTRRVQVPRRTGTARE